MPSHRANAQPRILACTPACYSPPKYFTVCQNPAEKKKPKSVSENDVPLTYTGAECKQLEALTKQDCIKVDGELQAGFWWLGAASGVFALCFMLLPKWYRF